MSDMVCLKGTDINRTQRFTLGPLLSRGCAERRHLLSGDDELAYALCEQRSCFGRQTAIGDHGVRVLQGSEGAQPDNAPLRAIADDAHSAPALAEAPLALTH